MFERIGRSWQLVKASAEVLSNDKELLVLPVVSGICSLIVAAAFLAPAYFAGMFAQFTEAAKAGGDPDQMMTPGLYAWFFGFYIVQYFVIIFFNTALVGAALLRLQGHNPTLGDALAISMARIGTIMGYAVISATVGVILRMIGERLGFIGRIIEGLIGVAWTISTFLVVPIIAAKGVGPITAVKESAMLLRKTWGENVIGNGGIGLAFSLIMFPIIFVGFGSAAYLMKMPGGPVLGIVVGAFTLLVVLALGIYSAALSGVYAAAVYRYAEGGSTMRGFDRSLLDDAFRHKK
jgi:uncharacterized protein DUF6159